MFGRWWFLELLRGGGDEHRPAKRRLTKEQQELVLGEWAVLRERLHGFAAARVADAGEVLAGAELRLTGDPARRNSAQRDYGWALEAYDAAGKLLDEAADLPDLAAAAVLAERAVERFAAADARSRGRRAPKGVTRCFYNPLHGAAAQPGGASRRPPRRTRPREAAANRRPACEDCRRAILAGQSPDVLPALVPVRTSRRHTAQVLVPYYAVPQQWSIWSATGCGAYGDESPGLVMRGDHRRRVAPVVVKR